ncbi:uronyl 2-sulfotransferase-like [Saccoglossus kowalevskii]|uniref:Uronyl 2-sulfotransferase-like n=1 Tax=Saccoglossus kowalevskii TaxID=10224 RepID=A0ABM0GT21_SACKO|nr:PREDICTED: uronyl 2-sulfotransferase-like [Saccoglossus kowalevskii]
MLNFVLFIVCMATVANTLFYLSVTQDIKFTPNEDSSLDGLRKYGESFHKVAIDRVNDFVKYGGKLQNATSMMMQQLLEKRQRMSGGMTITDMYDILWQKTKLAHASAMDKIYDLYHQFRSRQSNEVESDFDEDIGDPVFLEMLENLTRVEVIENENVIPSNATVIGVLPNDTDLSTNGYIAQSPPDAGSSLLPETSPIHPSSKLPLDITAHWNDIRLVYNRVDKCGSQTLLAVIGILSFDNDYRSIWSRVWNIYNVTETRQKWIASIINKQKPPYIFNRHLHYLNLSKFGFEQIPYINIIRDPLPRFISRYYFKRFGDNLQPNEDFQGNRTQTFDECVFENKPECMEEMAFQMIPYFCGQEPECRVPSRWALEMAKNRVVSDYVFVGVLEDFEQSLRIFEILLPQFFESGLKVYKTMIFGLKKYEEFQSPAKFTPSTMALEIMSQRLALEYEFYDFVRARMELIKEQLQLA